MRQRSHCIRIKPSVKFEENVMENTKKYEELDEIKETEKLKKDKTMIPRQSIKPSNDLKTPIFKNLKKEYPVNKTKPLYIHEKAQIIGIFNKSLIGDIEQHVQIINFDKFLYQFKNEDEVRNLELQDVLDVDYEKLEELKYKATEFIDATSILMEEKQGVDIESESQLLKFFSQKLEEMLNNEINLQIFVNNIEKLRGVSYSNNGVKLYFKKKTK